MKSTPRAASTATRSPGSFYDAESQTQKGLIATRRLINQDNVDMIVSGGNMSGIAIAMLGLTEKAGIPFISTEGAMAIVTPVAERQWMFKSTVDDEQVLERLADYSPRRGSRRSPSSATPAASVRAPRCR